MTEFLASLDADTCARLDTLTHKNIKYLFYRYNDFFLSRGLELSDIVHTKLSADEIVMERLQNRDWQYLIESVIYKVEKDHDYYKIKTVEDSEMIKDMEKNYRILRQVDNEIYTSITQNFQLYINSLKQSELEEIDTDFVCSCLNSIQNVDSVTKLMMLFEFFYFINNRFPTTTAQRFIPRADPPRAVNGDEVNIKKFYEKFRGTNSHGLVASQFLGALNIFFDGNPETTRKFSKT